MRSFFFFHVVVEHHAKTKAEETPGEWNVVQFSCS